jgi:TRAP-type C4-dicarboxylate transport system permease large subunit
MYALFTGVVTATEAAAASCALGLVICLIRRKLSWKGFVESIAGTLRISCMVFMILAGATIFGRFLAVTRLPFEAAAMISSLALPTWMLFWLILACYIIGGCVMDALAFLLISLPIFFPLVTQMGYDPIWFGQVVCIVTTMGSIMPPIGICCYVVAAMAPGIPPTVFREDFTTFAYILSIIVLWHRRTGPYWCCRTWSLNGGMGPHQLKELLIAIKGPANGQRRGLAYTATSALS